MTREADNPMTGCDFDWMVSNHAVLGWKAPVKASVSGVSLLQLSPFFASIFPLFPQKRLILRLGAPASRLIFQPGWGYSHTLHIWVCAAQLGRDYEAPGLERGIHFRGVF